jgi:hypothetical protein
MRPLIESGRRAIICTPPPLTPSPAVGRFSFVGDLRRGRGGLLNGVWGELRSPHTPCLPPPLRLGTLAVMSVVSGEGEGGKVEGGFLEACSSYPPGSRALAPQPPPDQALRGTHLPWIRFNRDRHRWSDPCRNHEHSSSEFRDAAPGLCGETRPQRGNSTLGRLHHRDTSTPSLTPLLSSLPGHGRRTGGVRDTTGAGIAARVATPSPSTYNPPAKGGTMSACPMRPECQSRATCAISASPNC